MDVFAAARALLDAIGAGGKLQPAWKPTHDFQLAWNASSQPFFSQEPKLKPDGIYGPLTTRALLHMVTLESQAASVAKPTDTGAAPADAGAWLFQARRELIGGMLEDIREDAAHAGQIGGQFPPDAKDEIVRQLFALYLAPSDELAASVVAKLVSLFPEFSDPHADMLELGYELARVFPRAGLERYLPAIPPRTGFANPEAVSTATVWRCFYDCTPPRKKTLVHCEPLFTGAYDAAELAASGARAELEPPAAGPKGYAIALLEAGDHPADTGCPWDSQGAVRTSGFDLSAALRDRFNVGAADARITAIAALARQMLQNLYGAPPSTALDNILGQLTYIAANPGASDQAIAILRASGPAEAQIAASFDALTHRTGAAAHQIHDRDVAAFGADPPWYAVQALADSMLANLQAAAPSAARDFIVSELTAIREHPQSPGAAIAALRRAGPAEASLAAEFDPLVAKFATGLDFHIDLGNVAHDLGNVAHDVEHVLTHPGQDVHDVASQAAWDVTHPAHVASDVAHTADEVRRFVRPVGDAYLSVAQSIVSLIPGLGTGVASALGAAQAILDGGGALDVAIRMAYGAIPIPPGLRQICDPIVDAVLALVDAAEHGKPLTDVVLQVVRDRLPAGLPRDVFDTLARVVAKKLTIERDPAAMKEHMTASYGGAGEHAKAVARGIARHVPPAAARHLKKLPPSSTRYPGVKRPPPPPPRPKGAPAPAVTLNASQDASSTTPAAPAPHKPAPPAPPRLRPGGAAASSSSSSSTTPRRRPPPPPPPPRATAPATTTDDTPTS